MFELRINLINRNESTASTHSSMLSAHIISSFSNSVLFLPKIHSYAYYIQRIIADNPQVHLVSEPRILKACIRWNIWWCFKLQLLSIYCRSSLSRNCRDDWKSDGRSKKAQISMQGEFCGLLCSASLKSDTLVGCCH